MNSITILVPVCTHRPSSLEKCIESLKKYVDEQHTVLLLDDLGDDGLMHALAPIIEENANFHYKKNAAPLGFAESCNQALSLLDSDRGSFCGLLILSPDSQLTAGCINEMINVLYECERNGAVCPRGNGSGFLAFPPRSNGADISPEQSRDIFTQVSPLLPDKTIIPAGFCSAILIKRELLDRFGLFDSAYSSPEAAVLDFCMRINQYGYNVAAANHSYIYVHTPYKASQNGKASDAAGISAPAFPAFDSNDSKLLSGRYPYCEGLIKLYCTEGMQPADYFADLIADDVYEKKRILFSLYEVPASYNGTAKFAIAIYENFFKLYKDKYDISLLINAEADRFHQLSKRYPNVYTPDTISETFHLAFSPSQIFRAEHMLILNRTCLKYIFCMQDIICIRSRHILIRELERDEVFRDSIRFCDMMTSISSFSLQDTMSYYSDEFAARKIPTRYIYHGTDKSYTPNGGTAFKLPYNRYFVVFGNDLKHKYISNTVEQLKKSKHNIIVIGSPQDGSFGSNIYCYRSGSLSDEFIDYVLGHCLGIIFPSLYEGFGLPFLDGMSYKKKLVVNNTQSNRELRGYFDNFKDNVFIFNKLEELEGILDEISANPEISVKDAGQPVRSWADSARELEECIRETLERPVDTGLLYERWKFYNYLSNIHINYAAKPVVGNYATKGIDREQFLQRMISRHPHLYNIYRKIIVLFDKDHYDTGP